MNIAEEISHSLNQDILDTVREATIGIEVIEDFINELPEHLVTDENIKIAGFFRGGNLCVIIHSLLTMRRAECIYDCHEETWRIDTIDENMRQADLYDTRLTVYQEAQRVAKWIKGGRQS